MRGSTILTCSAGAARIGTSTDGNDGESWSFGLQLQGMAGKLLSAEARWIENARVLCRASADGRDKLHVSRDATARDARAMGRADAGAFPLRAQGAAAHHTLRPLAQYR